MGDKPGKGYIEQKFCLFRPFRQWAGRPLAFVLAAVFLFAHAAAASPILHDWPGQSLDEVFVSPESECDLFSGRVEGRERCSARPGAERLLGAKLDLGIFFEVGFGPAQEAYPRDFRSIYTPLHGTSGCNAPFSPRPPPSSLLQG